MTTIEITLIALVVIQGLHLLVNVFQWVSLANYSRDLSDTAGDMSGMQSEGLEIDKRYEDERQQQKGEDDRRMRAARGPELEVAPGDLLEMKEPEA